MYTALISNTKSRLKLNLQMVLAVWLQVKEFAASTQLDLQRQIKAWEARAVMAEEQLAHLQVRGCTVRLMS
jgi:hypothetical protein